MRQRLVIWRLGNLFLILTAAVFFLLIPAGTLIRYLSDPQNGQPGVSRFAHDLFLDLTPKYQKWAVTRIADTRAEHLGTNNISGTEWPLFGSVFYLWAVESLQKSWQEDPRVLPFEPAKYARGAIEAATALLLDEKHAGWVKKHWGADYLTRQDLFYRALRISALTSHRNLTGSNAHLLMLRQETAALAAEIDRSPQGLLDDYPGECYPADVLMAWHVIARSGKATGDDYDPLLARGKRAFSGALLDRHGLIPFCSEAVSGAMILESQGCGNAYVGFCAPDFWPQDAKDWYARFEERFWDVRHGVRGFREFARDVTDKDWYMDVDSGPVLTGLGVSASAFGLAAARKNGRFDHALPLTGELLVASWPLPDGTLLLPRLLSNAADAPLLGEAAILFAVTAQPAPGFEIRATGGTLPYFVYGVWFLYLLLGVLLAMGGIRRFRVQIALADQLPDSAANVDKGRPVSRRMILKKRGASVQFAIWLGLLLVGGALFLGNWVLPGSLLLALSQFFPRGRVRRTAEDTPMA